MFQQKHLELAWYCLIFSNSSLLSKVINMTSLFAAYLMNDFCLHGFANMILEGSTPSWRTVSISHWNNEIRHILNCVTVTEHLCHNDHGYVPFVVSTFRSFPHSWLTTGFVTRVTRSVPLVEQFLLHLWEHLSSP
jgi:hypothetical protein